MLMRMVSWHDITNYLTLCAVAIPLHGGSAPHSSAALENTPFPNMLATAWKGSSASVNSCRNLAIVRVIRTSVMCHDSSGRFAYSQIMSGCHGLIITPYLTNDPVSTETSRAFIGGLGCAVIVGLFPETPSVIRMFALRPGREREAQK